jgi:hypothetical protein
MARLRLKKVHKFLGVNSRNIDFSRFPRPGSFREFQEVLGKFCFPSLFTPGLLPRWRYGTAHFNGRGGSLIGYKFTPFCRNLLLSFIIEGMRELMGGCWRPLVLPLPGQRPQPCCCSPWIAATPRGQAPLPSVEDGPLRLFQ